MTTKSTEQPKRTEGLEKAYKNEEEISKVLDEKSVDKKLLDRLPNPTGYRLLVFPESSQLFLLLVFLQPLFLFLLQV